MMQVQCPRQSPMCSSKARNSKRDAKPGRAEGRSLRERVRAHKRRAAQPYTTRVNQQGLEGFL